MAGNQIRELLQLADVTPSDKKATDWLSKAIEGARHNYESAKKRPLPADHNALLIDIEKSAKKLIKRIERLRRHPTSYRAFWRSSVFGPVHLDRFEVPEVLAALEKIEGAAGAAKDRRQIWPLPSSSGSHRTSRAALALARLPRLPVNFTALRPGWTPSGTAALTAK